MIATASSAFVVILAVIITYLLTKKREHESDWRKLKFAQYQEFVLALSGVVQERATHEAHGRYADAVNSMALVGPFKVLLALKNFQDEISFVNKNRSDQTHDKLLDLLLRAMREDIHPDLSKTDASFSFRILRVPPDLTTSKQADSVTRLYCRRSAVIRLSGFQGLLCHRKIVGDLQVHPEPGRCLETPPKQNGGFSSDAPVAVQDAGDAVSRHIQFARQSPRGQSKGQQELLAEHFSGCDRRQAAQAGAKASLFHVVA